MEILKFLGVETRTILGLKSTNFTITKENDTWVNRGKEVEKLLKMSRFDTDEAILRFSNKLRKLGIDDELRAMGAEDGDDVSILDFVFEFRE